MASSFFRGLFVVLVILFTTTESFLTSFDTAPLRIAAFNIRHFGRGVMDKPEVVSHLVQIFERYDIVLIQEVRDGTNTALDDLKKTLNANEALWDYTASDPLGRSKFYREQYVFFYKLAAANVMGTHQVNDSAQDIYEREPFAIEFQYIESDQTTQKRIVFLGLHTRPKDTKAELVQLPTTIKFVAGQFPNAIGVVAMGDMNADCNYLSGRSRKELEVFTSTEFKSLIDDSSDSAQATHSDCAYDRLIVYGKDIDVRNATVFNFEDDLKLSEDEASEVSDHYPIEFVLY